ncbi:uncharacterized protein ATNIH1004_000133 [Aspergillus tanneri]|uniref:Uncharacterized protein n=1 Tax=Aspergillus tanneri TaxID=1220188 RepID=A0A5M9N263_9EURO|nr:uncharacterized protein ATNIH1004_000133 [Aspergillus tanneri]KAA8651253.1 hypothetical protein ATNIH1004_000133 [Aspergillus tanneri]
MSGVNQFHTRGASLAFDDAQFIIAAFDSTLLYLASIGAVEIIQQSEQNEDATISLSRGRFPKRCQQKWTDARWKEACASRDCHGVRSLSNYLTAQQELQT